MTDIARLNEIMRLYPHKDMEDVIVDLYDHGRPDERLKARALALEAQLAEAREKLEARNAAYVQLGEAAWMKTLEAERDTAQARVARLEGFVRGFATAMPLMPENYQHPHLVQMTVQAMGLLAPAEGAPGAGGAKTTTETP